MLEREDIRLIGQQMIDDYIAASRMTADALIRITSGTSGKAPVMTLLSTDAFISPAYASWHWGGGRTLICFGPLLLRHANSVAQARGPEGSLVLQVDGSDLDEVGAACIADFAPQRIIGFPSMILRLGGLLDSETRARIADVKCAGELVTGDLGKQLRALFPAARFAGVYITSELGPISKETCGHRPLNQFHPGPGVTVEIHEPDETGAGDLLVSMTAFGGIPIRQYHVGDVARFVQETCACGEFVTFEILGRSGYDYIKIGGTLLIQAEFDRVVRLFPNVITDYRVEASTVITEHRQVGRIVLRVFSEHGPGTPALRDEIVEKISDALFLTADHTLADLVRAHEYEPLVVEWAMEPFPQAHKSVKIRRV